MAYEPATKYKRLILTRSRSWHSLLQNIDGETEHLLMRGHDVVRIRYRRYQQLELSLKRSNSLNCFATRDYDYDMTWPRRRSSGRSYNGGSRYDKKSPLGRLLDYLPAANQQRAHAKFRNFSSLPTSPLLQKSSLKLPHRVVSKENSAPSLVNGDITDKVRNLIVVLYLRYE